MTYRREKYYIIVYLPKVRNVQKFQERYLDLATRDGIMQGIILM